MHFTSNFCRSSSLPSSPSGWTGTLKYSPSSWDSSLNLNPRVKTDKIQDYYQGGYYHTPAPSASANYTYVVFQIIHHLLSSSWHLTIRLPLVSVAPRSQRRGIPWSRSCWSNPSPRPPLTDGGPCHFLLGCCESKEKGVHTQVEAKVCCERIVQPKMKIQESQGSFLGP